MSTAFDSEQLLEDAAQQTGLSDFGSPTFREGLDRLVDSLEHDAALSDLGRAMAEGQISALLRNRLRVEDWWRAHPELADARIERPIVIVGMSRSGTTALSHLLGKDPALRSLVRWEAMESVPPPEPASRYTDPRYLAAVESDEASDLVLPGLKALHHDPPDAPVECNQLFAHEFQGSNFWTTFHLPSYFEWTNAANLTDAYAYHARMLALLQSRLPGRWSLKGPQHGVTMEALRARYPDATLIVTHRDPSVCAMSTASLLAFLRNVTSSDPRPEEAGEMARTFIGHCVDGLLADARKHTGHDAMLHVSYQELVRDPMAVVRDLYPRIGLELTPEVEQAMKTHIDERPQHRHGVHRYEAADFGLAKNELDERFRSYREQFDVPREPR